MLEMLSNNYLKLKENEMKIFKQIQFIFNEYLYSPRHEPINMTMLYSDFKDLGNLIYIKMNGKKKTTSLSESSSVKSSSSKSSSSKSSSNLSSKMLTAKKLDKASGINKKTRKNRGERTNVSFDRKPQQKRFKNPVFLSIK
jgi:hypothetical protein